MSYLKLSRNFFASELWTRQKIFPETSAWLDLLRMAAYRDTSFKINGITVTCHAGELVTTQNFLAVRWSWDRSKVQRFLAFLSEKKMITHSSISGRVTLIHIISDDENELKGEQECEHPNILYNSRLPFSSKQTLELPNEHNNKNNINNGKEGKKKQENSFLLSFPNISNEIKNQTNETSTRSPRNHDEGREARTAEFLRGLSCWSDFDAGDLFDDGEEPDGTHQ